MLLAVFARPFVARNYSLFLARSILINRSLVCAGGRETGEERLGYWHFVLPRVNQTFAWDTFSHRAPDSAALEVPRLDRSD